MEISLLNENNPKIHESILLITGDGMSLPADLKLFSKMALSHDVFCIGRSYRLVEGNVDHWGDVDGQETYSWAESLRLNWRNGPQRHTLGETRGFDFYWNIERSLYPMSEIMWHGSTAFFATLIGLKMGYEAIILAGCPLDSRGHWYFANLPENEGPKWPGETYMTWLDFIEHNPCSVKVKSLSGYTKTMLGGVTHEWLKSIQQK